MKLSDYLEKHKKEKISNIILDLDETIISAIYYEDFNQNKEKMIKKLTSFTYHHMDKDYVITERPHIQKFLDFLFNNFNVSVWTAASKSYALFVIQNVILKNNRKLDYILYNSHCDVSKTDTGCIKNLEKLFHIHGYNKKNTLIIDDNLDVFSKQTNKIINIKPFVFFRDKSEKDNELIKIEKFLQMIKN